MKNKIKNKKIISVLLTLILCFSIINPIYATGGIITSTVQPSLGEGQNAGKIAEMVSQILGYLQFICWAIAVGMIMYIGIKYVMSAANERAELKNSSIRFVIGALMIGAASSVFTIIWNIANGLGATGSGTGN